MQNTAKTMEEFNEQARAFAVKAAAAGKSNTAIANTVKLKYQMFLDEQANKITPYQQATLDLQERQLDITEANNNKADLGFTTVEDANGNQILVQYDKTTGQAIPVFNPSSFVEEGDAYNDDGSTTTGTGAPVPSPEGTTGTVQGAGTTRLSPTVREIEAIGKGISSTPGQTLNLSTGTQSSNIPPSQLHISDLSNINKAVTQNGLFIAGQQPTPFQGTGLQVDLSGGLTR